MKFNEFIFAPEDRDNPLKVVYEDDTGIIQTNDCTIEVVRKLTSMESVKLIKNIFSTTDVGILD